MIPTGRSGRLSAWVWVPGSAALLIFAFPPFDQPWCAWLGLVPLLLGASVTPARRAFGLSYLSGLLFFLGTLPWLIHVTLVGWLALSAVTALFFAAFGAVVAWSAPRAGPGWLRRLGLAALWAALEWVRGHLFTGFGWNLLGYSQTPWLPFIQLADLTGVWGISSVLVLGNALLADLWAGRGRRLRLAVALTALVACSGGYGLWRLPGLRAQAAAAARVKVAVVQGNIPQDEKWDEDFRDVILHRYEQWTREAAATEPQLIVWPETSVPDYLWLDEEVTQRVVGLAREVKVPLLVGAPMGNLEQGAWRTTNSAALLDPQGALTQRYDKLHLVPFGEFVPFEDLLPWLRGLMPTIGDFSSGREATVFRSPTVAPFGVLICFEDIFPELARALVRRGAHFLLVITNDAWFGPTAAAYQHAQASALRAVELRVPLARAANTGWSGCVSAAGETLASVRDPQGLELFVPGTATCELPLAPAFSLYRQWGDWWVYGCGLVGLCWLGWLRRRR